MLQSQERSSEGHGKSVRSAARALEVLSCFSITQPEWGINDVSEYLGYAPSVVHRFLKTLCEAKLVERTPTRRYRLGIRAAELGNVFRFQGCLAEADDILDKFTTKACCVAHLAKLDDYEVVELLRSRNPAIARRSTPVRMPLHCTALGKALLAYDEPDNRSRYFVMREHLRPFTPKTITVAAKLRAQLERIVMNGFAMDDEESRLGVHCLAVPVRSKSGTVVAALSMSGRIDLIHAESFRRFLKDLRSAAESIGAAWT